MLGQMMTEPLLLARVLTHAEKYHGDEEVVSQMPGGQVHRYTYRDLGRRVRSTAGALAGLGLQAGACIATLAWNTYRHLELYFAIPCLGSVCHTINPRLFHEQIVYIINHAEDAALFFDVSFAPLVATLRSRCPTVKYWIALAEADGVPPETPFAQSYEALLARQQGFPEWPSFDENTACLLCYTSGTTGNPKGVLFSHRTTLLHSLATALPDALSVSAREVVCPVVPMFHANGWGLPFTCPMVGAKLVLAGKDTDGESLYRLFEAEGVTFAGAVPTVWQGVIDHLQAHGLRFGTLRRFLVGGASCPPSIIRTMWQDYGVDALPGWGMTELSPIGTLTAAKRKHCALGGEERLQFKSSHGRPLFGVDLRLRGMHGEELACDGQSVGELQVRGLWTVDRYFRSEQSALVDGWFSTGDIATIDGDGYLRITDRSKDMIKSGGEWISSIELESIATSHPAVAMAAAIGVASGKWGERPLLVVVQRSGGEPLTKQELLAWYEGKVAKWWIPDDVLFVPELPMTATGKLSKLTLRKQYQDYRLPAEGGSLRNGAGLAATPAPTGGRF